MHISLLLLHDATLHAPCMRRRCDMRYGSKGNAHSWRVSKNASTSEKRGRCRLTKVCEDDDDGGDGRAYSNI